MLHIEVNTTDEDGIEHTHKLPAKYAVCGNCEGHGVHMNQSMREHAYTREEIEQEFSPEMQEEYFRRGGIYDVQCETCHGKRVVLVVDREVCRTEEQQRVLAILDKQAREDADYERLVRSEIAHGC